MVKRRDGRIVRVLLLALPGEIARPSPRSTVLQDLPMTYAHRENPLEWRCRQPYRVNAILEAAFGYA